MVLAFYPVGVWVQTQDVRLNGRRLYLLRGPGDLISGLYAYEAELYPWNCLPNLKKVFLN